MHTDGVRHGGNESTRLLTGGRGAIAECDHHDPRRPWRRPELRLHEVGPKDIAAEDGRVGEGELGPTLYERARREPLLEFVGDLDLDGGAAAAGAPRAGRDDELRSRPRRADCAARRGAFGAVLEQ